MNSTEKCRRWGHVCTIGWGMLFCFNMIMYLWTKSLFSLFLAGFMLGGCLTYLITNPHMNWQAKFIDEILRGRRQSIESVEKHIKLLKLKKGNLKKRRPE